MKRISKKREKEMIKAIKLKKIVFNLKKDGKEQVVNGINLFDKLEKGWLIQSFRMKKSKNETFK